MKWIALLLTIALAGCIKSHPTAPVCSPVDTLHADSTAIVTVRICR